MMPSSLQFAALLTCLTIAASAWGIDAESTLTFPKKKCIFAEFPRDDAINAWEFQVKLPRSKTRFPFEKVATMMQALFKQIHNKHVDINITVDFPSRVSKVFTQDGWSLTTYDGKKIYPETLDDNKRFPWTDGYMRKRQSILLLDPEAYDPTPNGTCPYNFHNTDLTVKFRHINMSEFDPVEVSKEFPEKVLDVAHNVEARLTKTVECDIYCNAANLQYKAKYAPVSMHQKTDTLEDVMEFYPGLDEVVEVHACAPLPYRGSKYQREARWRMDVNGVQVLTTLTLEYGTQAKAFTGNHKSSGGEISLRMMRSAVIDAMGEFDYAPVSALAEVISDVHNAGWDFLKPTSNEELTWEDAEEPEECGCGVQHDDHDEWSGLESEH